MNHTEVDQSEFDQKFKTVYISYYAKMKRFAYRYLLSEVEAENIVHDIFLELLENKGLFFAPTNMMAYLFSAVKNKCIDHLRKQDLIRRTEEEMQEEQAITLQLNLNSLEVFDENLFSSKEIEELIRKAIGSLPEKCRKIFIMNKFQGKKQKTIAKELGITVNTVETQMRIAYKKLKKELTNYLPLFLFLFY